MRHYTQLTCEERYQIHSLLRAGHLPSEIARLIKRDKSTISRELSRNRGPRGYRARQAQRLAVARRRGCAGNARRFDACHWHLIERLIQRQWSPEQIAGRLGLLKRLSISPERIYCHMCSPISKPAVACIGICAASASERSATGARAARGNCPIG